MSNKLDLHYIRSLVKDYFSPACVTNNAGVGGLHRQATKISDFFDQKFQLSDKQLYLASKFKDQIERYRQTSEDLLMVHMEELIDIHEEVLKVHERIRTNNENDYQTGYAYQGHRARLKKINEPELNHRRIYPYHFHGLIHQFRLFDERQEEYDSNLEHMTNQFMDAYWTLFESNKK